MASGSPGVCPPRVTSPGQRESLFPKVPSEILGRTLLAPGQIWILETSLLVWGYLEWWLWEVLRFRLGDELGSPWWYWYLYKKRHQSTRPSASSLSLLSISPLPLSAILGHSKKMAICKPGKEFPAKANRAGTLISDFQPPDLWQIYTCCLSHLVQVFELQQPDWTKILVIRCYSYSFMGKFYFLWIHWIDVNEVWSYSFLL